MGAKLGLSHERKNVDWGRFSTRCGGEYLDL